MEESPKKQRIADFLWGEKSSIWLVVLVAIISIFTFLGAKEIWTQEWRWANIAHQMMIRGDLFHPYLAGHDYYDKPLLSYWLIISVSLIFKQLSIWAIRLPSAIAGLLTILCTYEITLKLSSRRTAMIAAWLLTSTGYFIFWSRVGNTDMLNIAGILLALLWYFKRRDNTGFFSYLIFFIIIAIASLMKGLIAPAVIFIALVPDFLYGKRWKQHLRPSFFIAAIIGLAIYLTPFILSRYINPTHYQESGLWLVFKENVLRYIKPFDHKGPWYLYFEYLPLAIAPWILFTIPALLTFPFRWHRLTLNSRWYFWSFVLIFLFFTFSGSRRNYYILPMIPFAILFTADWLSEQAEKKNAINRWAGILVMIIALLVMFVFAVAMPLYYYNGGPSTFATQIKQTATKMQPWDKWQVQVLATNNNLTYYLRSNHPVFSNKTKPETSKAPTLEKLQADFPILKSQDKNIIIVIGRNYYPLIKDSMKNYTVIKMQPTLGNTIVRNFPKDAAVALIPTKN